MVLATNTVFAARCPVCGKLDYHDLSIFSFSGYNKVEIKCDCDALKLVIGTKNYRQFWLQIPCPFCESKHLKYLNYKDFWNDRIHYIYCQETGIELGAIGSRENIEQVSCFSEERTGNSFIEELGEDDYFSNPDIMYQVLNRLHDIAEKGELYCQCGNNHIEVDIFPDRLELQCGKCDSLNIIYAETQEDLEVIEDVDKIELLQNGFKCLDSISNNKNNLSAVKNIKKNSKRNKPN